MRLINYRSSPVEPDSAGRKWLLGASATTAVMASLCCILPIVAAVTGLGLLGVAAKFEQWRPYLLGVTGLLLLAGSVVAYRDYKKACAPGSLCATKPVNRWNFIALAMVAASVGGLAAFPRYSGVVAEAMLGAPVPASHTFGSAVLSKIAFRIPDMDCPACAAILSNRLRKMPGVAEARLDVENRKVIVTFDAAAQSVAEIKKVISDAGFHIAQVSQS